MCVEIYADRTLMVSGTFDADLMCLTPEVEEWVGELWAMDERLQERALADPPKDFGKVWTGWKGISWRSGGAGLDRAPFAPRMHHPHVRPPHVCGRLPPRLQSSRPGGLRGGLYREEDHQGAWST